MAHVIDPMFDLCPDTERDRGSLTKLKFRYRSIVYVEPVFGIVLIRPASPVACFPTVAVFLN